MRVPAWTLLLVALLTLASCNSAEEINEPPSVGFSFSPQSPSAGTSVSFTAQATDPDGQVESFQWEFGDGASATGRTPTHTYEAAGSYTVTVTVTDDRNGTDRARKTVEVQ
jgi:chitinase